MRSRTRSLLTLALVLAFVESLPARASSWEVVVAPGAVTHNIGFDPTNPDRIFVGTWGRGMYRSQDGGVTWNGDMGSFQTPSGNDAPIVYEAAFDPDDPSRGIAITRRGTYVTTTGGVTWSLHPANFDDTAPYNGYSIVPLPDGSGVVMSEAAVGLDGGRLFVLDWQTDEITIGEQSERLRYYSTSSVLGVSFAVDGALYVGHTTAPYITYDLGETFVRNGRGLPDNEIRSLVTDPQDPGVALCAVDGGLYRQSGRGTDWRPFGAGLPSPVRTLIHHPQDPNRMYAASNFGVYESLDRGASWSPMPTEGLRDLIIVDVAIHPLDPTTLYATTSNFFRTDGALHRFRLDAVTSIDDLPGGGTPTVTRIDLRGAPNPFIGRTELSFRLAEASDVRLHVFDVAGRRVLSLVDRRLAAGEHIFAWTGADAGERPVGRGVYFARLVVDGVLKGRTKLTLDR